ncbi:MULTISPECIES: cobaltochelatase subunit CobN [Methylosinus]|uniref:Cobaltochelatase subunit CobN n=1 Tax=Methylosinus trichosporium (strain ATCC 35070 / NCIMB 11131 / UNIQEM 75 / OB3b) TaxID=595536 RepID=A0A2D2D3I7_METT3|nr:MULTISPECIES: cobaltochelatase subunit CobN [Methylosinus]ATQ69534.1 cobaltochelatase subunit CobN [Methylosinus trichosporium OB3b]OBS50504.1 cobaltochelatase subunit CobN [Methylosinus sp. 3S-1]
MHLLAIQQGQLVPGDEAVDLGQTPGAIVVLSAADSDLSCLAAAAARRPADAPSLRLANPLGLAHPLSVDLYVEKIIASARCVCVRLLGGRSYWPYGLDEIARVCRERGVAFAALLSDDADDPESEALSTIPVAERRRLLAYLIEGGADNARNFLSHAAYLIGAAPIAPPPRPMPEAGLYRPGAGVVGVDDIVRNGAPVAALVFYRHMVASGATAAIDALCDALARAGLDPLPIFAPSLKNPFARSLIADLFERLRPAVILNATAFAASAPGEERRGGPFDAADAAVLQAVMAASSEEAWRADARGLGARDLAMNVALPEVDGRILAGAAAFKAQTRFDALTQCPVIEHAPAQENIPHIAAMAAGWARLRAAPAQARRIAIILANYPNRDGRLANGVGLDTPESAITILEAMAAEGYDVAGRPQSARALMDALLAGPTNAPGERDATEAVLSLDDYESFFATLPEAMRSTIMERWGAPERDPFFARGGFRLAIHRYGAVVVGVQPARGYNIDPKGSYHDPALPPPHGYLAFYAWLRRDFDAHAIVHLGKHGNLEWLPGKALALSASCFPRAIAGAIPQLYPFIVNDPGEGSQAKRRIGAVIVDHLTPPLTRAESYGPLKALEALVDEYYAASGMDRRRLAPLKAEILDLARSHGLDRDAGVAGVDDDEALSTLDNYLCELKEMQIRDGLHVFGRSPEGRLRTDLLVALARTPRRHGEGGDASLIRSLAQDLGLGLDFDPLDCRLGETWSGARPAALAAQSGDAWRTCGDTVERLELLAVELVARTRAPEAGWTRTRAVLDAIDDTLAPRVNACGAAEIDALMRGLSGRFVAPGPSGAPTRGRPDVLPTGRNFYSVDTRAVPTPTAWRLGFASAQRLCEDHLQRSGEPLRAVALSAWGTANMRTGGDDIAQALALMGVRPQWHAASGRVTGFEVLPLAMLGRSRVDVTMRVSGFFRDAFIDQIALIDAAARAVMALDEEEEDNPAAARFARETAAGASARRASARVFGAQPGAYGAGLQAMIDEKLWRERRDLAEAFLLWGRYAYGDGLDGEENHAALETRLAQVDAVVHNQDNREHDLLDSDDYYQFEGGLSAAVEAITGRAPIVYHNDHSRPERPIIRTLDEEIARVIRARVVNPKWIAGAMRHGYKGAFEIAASVDYLYAFAATTGAVKDHHFDLVYQAFIEDETVRGFMADANPHALREACARLEEAIERGLWKPRSNSAGARLAELRGDSDERDR